MGTYASDGRRLADVAGAFDDVRIDVAGPDFAGLVSDARPSVIVHFAAETHVTRSESDGERFFRSNVNGTRQVLDAADGAEVGLVVHVSTDEVYGPCLGKPFRERDKAPGEGLATSVYARSKALADDLATSYRGNTKVIVVRLTNCFGPWQHPEKAIPRWIIRGLCGNAIPVWGGGAHVRDWMHVEDACDAIDTILGRGTPGTVYNVAPEAPEKTNLAVARMVAAAIGRSEESVNMTAYDRPHHDVRYAIDSSLCRALGWSARLEFESALTATIEWYRNHEDWWSTLLPAAEAIYAD